MSSAVLQALKTVKEQLPDNYTSGQLFEVLDTMMYRAIEPLIAHTKYVDRSLSIVLAWYAQNHRRRISTLPKRRLTAYVIAFLASSDPKTRIKLYQKMRLERNITFFLISHWLEIIGPWRALHIKACRGQIPKLDEQMLMLQCCVVNPNHLWGDIAHATYWLDQALKFKHMIVEKYMRLVMLEANAYWQIQRRNNPHLDLNLDELAQNFMLAVIKAIDKFDARAGTLTAYVQRWFQNAKITQVFRGEYGIAYTIPHSKRTSIARSKDPLTRNISVSVESEEALSVADERSVEGQLMKRQEAHRVREVAKFSDPSGIGRLLLGIAETLSDDELRLLLTAKVDHGTEPSSVLAEAADTATA